MGTSRTNKIDAAMDESKDWYARECIFLGHYVGFLVGSHIFKRGSYAPLADDPFNIVPASTEFDAKIEAIENPWKRIEFIRIHCHESWREKVNIQLDTLVRKIFIIEAQGGSIKW